MIKGNSNLQQTYKFFLLYTSGDQMHHDHESHKVKWSQTGNNSRQGRMALVDFSLQSTQSTTDNLFQSKSSNQFSTFVELTY